MNKSLVLAAAACFALSSGTGLLSAQAAPAGHAATSASATASGCLARTVDSRTNLVLDKHFVHRGDANGAMVHVRSDAAAHPRGTISLSVSGSQSGFGYEGTLSKGMAMFTFPRHMAVGSYDLRATYIPEHCSKWKRSLSSVEHLTVNPR